MDAAFQAINRVMGVSLTLAEYTIGAVSGGADALGEVRVVVESGGRTFSAQAVSTDITEASAEAYLRACCARQDGDRTGAGTGRSLMRYTTPFQERRP